MRNPGTEHRRRTGHVLRVPEDRKSTRLNSSHLVISYAVFCLKKKQSPRVRSVLFAAILICELPSQSSSAFRPTCSWRCEDRDCGHNDCATLLTRCTRYRLYRLSRAARACAYDLVLYRTLGKRSISCDPQDNDVESAPRLLVTNPPASGRR